MKIEKYRDNDRQVFIDKEKIYLVNSENNKTRSAKYKGMEEVRRIEGQRKGRKEKGED